MEDHAQTIRTDINKRLMSRPPKLNLPARPEDPADKVLGGGRIAGCGESIARATAGTLAIVAPTPADESFPTI